MKAKKGRGNSSFPATHDKTPSSVLQTLTMLNKVSAVGIFFQFLESTGLHLSLFSRNVIGQIRRFYQSHEIRR